LLTLQSTYLLAFQNFLIEWFAFWNVRKLYQEFSEQFMPVLEFGNCLVQRCGLRKITGRPKVPNHEILGAQYLSLYEKVSFSSHPKAKVSHLWYPGASKAQRCSQKESAM